MGDYPDERILVQPRRAQIRLAGSDGRSDMEDRPTRAARSQLGNRELLLGAGAPCRGFATAGPKILGLAQSAYSNSTFDRGSLSPTYIKPFDVFARGAKLEIGSPVWTTFATGSSVWCDGDGIRQSSIRAPRARALFSNCCTFFEQPRSLWNRDRFKVLRHDDLGVRRCSFHFRNKCLKPLNGGVLCHIVSDVEAIPMCREHHAWIAQCPQ